MIKKVPFVAFCHPAQGQVSLSRFIESPLFQSCGENFSIPFRLGRRHYCSGIDGRTKTLFCFSSGKCNLNFPPKNEIQKTRENIAKYSSVVKTFRFNSGLAGDITVQELMAEPKLCFAFPQVKNYLNLPNWSRFDQNLSENWASKAQSVGTLLAYLETEA